MKRPAALRAVVTGVAGFIGSRLAEHLVADGHEVLGVDGFTPYYGVEVKRSNLEALLDSTGFSFVEADLRECDLEAILDGVDVIFHLAGQPGVRLSWAEGFGEYASHNILATQRLLEASKRRSVGRVVYASSSSVYGNSPSYPTTEGTLLRPYSPYGVTKLAAEHLCTLYADNWGISTVSLRYFTVYGPRQRPDMAVHRLVEAALHGHPFPLYGNGQQIRDFTYVDDVVAATILAATAEVPAGTVVNISGGSSTTMVDLIQEVASACDKPIEVQVKTAQPGDVDRTGGSTSRALEVLGWQPLTDLPSGLSRQVQWHRSQARGKQVGSNRSAAVQSSKKQSMHIVFVYGQDSELRAREDAQRASGGTATALLELSASLAQRGHEVDVFARCEDPGVHRAVRFHRREELAAFAEVFQPDAVVVVPDGLALLFPIRTRARVLWSDSATLPGDVALSADWPAAPQDGNAIRRARLYPVSMFSSSIDLVVAKSDWQRRHLHQHMPLPEERIRVMFNGVDLDLFLASGWPRDRHRIVYTSQARRGLSVLLDLFPAIREAVPQAELHVFSHDDEPPSWLLDRAATLSGVHWRGRLSRAALADELRSAAVMAYPSTFDETFCTSVAEAQAAGLPVVCSSEAALLERVRDGIDGYTVDGDPRSYDFRKRFVDSVVRLLQNDALRFEMGSAATAMAAQRYDWSRIAAQWETELLEVATGKPLSGPGVAAPHLLDSSLLRVTDGDRTSQVSSDAAEAWLRRACRSYGYEVVPSGLRATADVSP